MRTQAGLARSLDNDMEIVSDKNRTYYPRARRGAALMYALLVVFILSLIVLAIGRLVTSHFQAEEDSATYSRLIYSAEAAANWQLTQVSRTVPDGSVAPPGMWTVSGGLTNGRVLQSAPADDLSGQTTGLMNGDFGGNIQVNDIVQSWIESGQGNQWTPPFTCTVYAIARDPATGMKRGVSFSAKGTGLADRFSLFGTSSLTFGAGTQTIGRGFIGSNGPISYTGNQPVSANLNNSSGLRGCLITGPDASLTNPGGWPADWDYPRFGDKTVLPTIATVISAIIPGADVNTLGTSGRTANSVPGAIGVMIQKAYSNGPILSVNNQFVPVSNQPVTKLTGAEFGDTNSAVGTVPGFINPQNGKPYHVIRLHTTLAATQAQQVPNVFYFTDIKMTANDILLLDLRQPPSRALDGSPQSVTNNTACRIVIHNTLIRPAVITNVAIVQSTNKDEEGTGDSSYILYNDTNLPLVIKPNITVFQDGSQNFYDSTTDTQYPPYASNTNFPPIIYTLTPGWPGLVYGIRAPNPQQPVGVQDNSGSITIDGSLMPPALPATIVSAIGNQVLLTGNVSVIPPSFTYNGVGITRVETVDSEYDPFRFVYFYRVNKSYQEINTTNYTGMSGSAYGYGGAP